jgi:hypothetical protein
MIAASIFFDFNLPNATTWFYFSFLLAVALFFKFSRLLSVRNLDILLLFLLVPGLLLVMEEYQSRESAAASPAFRAARIIAGGNPMAPPLGAPGANLLTLGAIAALPERPYSFLPWAGYLWLLCVSLAIFIRCLLDLGLMRRPALSPNLNLAGLAWLGAALFICLVAVAIRKPTNPVANVGRRSFVVDETQRRAEGLVRHEIAAGNVGNFNTRFWVECVSAVICHLAIVGGLFFVGWKHFQDPHGGVAAATFYLLLPYTAYHVDQVHHVLPAALLLWAMAAFRYPALAGLLLGVASSAGYFPALLLPAWISFYWKRGAGRFLAAFCLAAGVCMALIGLILWFNEGLTPSINAALSLADWQPWREPSTQTHGLWTRLPWAWAYRLPVFIAFGAFVGVTAFWPAPKNLAHLLALSTAVVVGIQFWFADQGGAYVLWYLPLLLLVIFRPNLSEHFPRPIAAESDWLGKFGRRIRHWAARILRFPEPMVRV